MKSNVNFDLSFEESNPCFRVLDVPSESEIRMGEIRRTSNVIQALENVLIQAEESPDFEGLRETIQGYLEFSKQRMLGYIHQP